MKIKNVIKACKQRRQIVYVEHNDEKWLGDGASLWLMPAYLDCSENGIFGTFDFSDTERGKVLYTEKSESNLRLDFYSKDEGAADIMDIALQVKGDLLRPIKTETGIIYIKERYFNIFTDKSFNIRIKYQAGGEPMLAVYEGYLLIGLIMPVRAATGELCDLLDVLHKDMKAELKNVN